MPTKKNYPVTARPDDTRIVHSLGKLQCTDIDVQDRNEMFIGGKLTENILNLLRAAHLYQFSGKSFFIMSPKYFNCL